MAYNATSWKDEPDETTPTSAENFNKMEHGIKAGVGFTSKADVSAITATERGQATRINYDGSWWNFYLSSTDVEDGGSYAGTVAAPDNGLGRWIRGFSYTLLGSWFGLSSSNSAADNFTAMNLITAAAEKYGRAEILFDEKDVIYNIDCTSDAISLPSNTVLNLNGNELHRTDSENKRTMGNKNYGGTVDKSIQVINGKITGVGADGNVTDQGSAITFYGCENYLIKNIETDATTGDGIGLRTGSGRLENIKIGDYGRNGWSPTSGIVSIDGLEVTGSPFTGANPGKDIDGEINQSIETSELTMNNVKAKDATFVDLVSTVSGEEFKIKLRGSNCTFGGIGGKVYPLRIKSTVQSEDADVIFDSTCRILSDGKDNAVTLDNVGGCTIDAEIDFDDEAVKDGTPVAVSILNTVNGLSLGSSKVNCSSSKFGIAVQCFGDARLNNAEIRVPDLYRVYLAGSNNRLSSFSLPTVAINGADSVGNNFDVLEPITSLSSVDSADIASQYFGGSRGRQSSTFYSSSEDVPNGISGASTTYDITLNVPSSEGEANGRVYTVVAGYTHKGHASHWAHFLASVQMGDTSSAAVNVVSSAGDKTIEVLSQTTSAITLRLTYQFEGVFSCTVIG